MYANSRHESEAEAFDNVYLICYLFQILKFDS